MTTVQKADLVLEGGGVKGAALVGAVGGLEAAGFSWVRVAGTSAGAVVASLIAAGYPVDRPDPSRPGLPTLHQVMRDHAFSTLIDPTLPTRFGGLPGEIASAIFNKGMYKSDNLHALVSQLLAAAGVRTWADLKLPDDSGVDPATPASQRYKLMVTVTDHTRHEALKLPWDFARYGYTQAEWDTFPVADAVVASCLIPGFFEPAVFTSKASPGSPAQKSYWVDGGVTSNFPVDAFDRPGAAPPRWPTIGVRLEAKPNPSQQFALASDPISYYLGFFDTILNGRDNELRNDPRIQGRTVFVDTSYVGSTDFNLPPATVERLFRDGAAAGYAFGQSFDLTRYRVNEQQRRETALGYQPKAPVPPGRKGPSAGGKGVA